MLVSSSCTHHTQLWVGNIWTSQRELNNRINWMFSECSSGRYIPTYPVTVTPTHPKTAGWIRLKEDWQNETIRRTHTGKRGQTNRVRLQLDTFTELRRVNRVELQEYIYSETAEKLTGIGTVGSSVGTRSTNTEWLQYCSYQMVQMQEEIEYQ